MNEVFDYQDLNDREEPKVKIEEDKGEEQSVSDQTSKV